MVSFFLRNGELRAHDVDVKRLARVFRRMSLGPDGLPRTSMNEALDEACRALGANDEYDARKRAADPDVRFVDEERIQAMVRERSVSMGRAFPTDLRGRFGSSWQRETRTLFKRAVSLRTPGTLEFVAVIGSPGSGKTLLCNQACIDYGGVVIDPRLASMGKFTSLYSDVEKMSSFENGEVLVLDQSVRPAMRANSLSPFPLWNTTPINQRRLSDYIEFRRVVSRQVPRDEISVGGSAPPRDWVTAHRGATLVVVFETLADVDAALRSYVVMSGSGSMEASSHQNWRCAHVVDLDKMSVATLDGPGIEMEQGRYVHDARVKAAETAGRVPHRK